MSTITLYSACSLNHKIAREDGSVSWLDDIDHPEGEDYGYHDFYASIDTTIMGYSTFQQLLAELQARIQETYTKSTETLVKRARTEEVSLASDGESDYDEEKAYAWLFST